MGRRGLAAVASDLVDYEVEVLQHLAGNNPGLQYGSALMAAIGFLKGSGYVEKAWDGKSTNYKLTQKSRDYLASLDEKKGWY